MTSALKRKRGKRIPISKPCPPWPKRLTSRGDMVYGYSRGFSGPPLEGCGWRGQRHPCPSCHQDIWRCILSCPVPVLLEGQEQPKDRVSLSLPVCTMQTLFRACHTGQYASTRMTTPHDTPCCICITDYLYSGDYSNYFVFIHIPKRTWEKWMRNIWSFSL